MTNSLHKESQKDLLSLSTKVLGGEGMDSSRSSNISSFQNGNLSIEDGLVEVRDGKVIVTDPLRNGKMARIRPGKGITILINGSEILSPTAVCTKSDIKVILPNRNPDRKFDINIDDDFMQASAMASYIDGEEYSIKPAGPSDDLTIEAVLDKKTEAQCFTLDEALEFLKQKGVTYGIIEENLKESLKKGNAHLCVVAKGLETVDGVDDTIDFKFNEEKKFSVINGRVDYYSIGRVESVLPGEIVAEKIVGTDGQPGIDVFNNERPAKPGKKLNIVAGKGAELSSDGTKVYSKIKGRPEIKGNIVSVYELYEVKSNVDITTGNIEFAGDIIIKGDVTDGMKAKAGNNLTIQGNVTRSSIFAGGDVKINKNVIGCSINGGSVDFVKLNIIDILVDISEGLGSLFNAAETLKDTGKIPKTYKDGKIIKLLVDTKFKHIEKSTIDLRSLLFKNKDYIGSDMIELGARLIKYFVGNGPLLIENQSELVDLKDMVIEQIEVLKNQLKKPANIYVNYIQNSSLTTNGNIFILGKGCYNSQLSCRGSVSFEKQGSVMRGGSISAGGDVKIYECGSASGPHTLVGTAKDATIYCQVAHVNTVFKVGDMSKRMDRSVRKVKAYQYKGEIMVECLKL